MTAGQAHQCEQVVWGSIPWIKQCWTFSTPLLLLLQTPRTCLLLWICSCNIVLKACMCACLQERKVLKVFCIILNCQKGLVIVSPCHLLVNSSMPQKRWSFKMCGSWFWALDALNTHQIALVEHWAGVTDSSICSSSCKTDLPLLSTHREILPDTFTQTVLSQTGI